MKKHLLSALLLWAALLTACGPWGGHSAGSAGGPARPPAAGDLLPPVDSVSSSVGPSAPDSNAPAPEVLAAWWDEYRDEIRYLRQSLPALARDCEMADYTRLPDGREWVDVGDFDLVPILFSGPAAQEGSVSAAIAPQLHRSATLADLQAEWGDSLTFQPDDPLAGPSWTAGGDGITYHFRTDPQGKELTGNLVISVDSLAPAAPDPDWLSPDADNFPPVQAEGLLAGLLPHAQVLGTSQPPSGATEPLSPEYLDYFYSGYGLEDPDTGVRYLSYEGGENTLWDGVIVPVGLVLDVTTLNSPDEVMAALNVPYRWGAYELVGYWFYLEDYIVYLSSDYAGAVPEDGYFLIRQNDVTD